MGAAGENGVPSKGTGRASLSEHMLGGTLLKRMIWGQEVIPRLLAKDTTPLGASFCQFPVSFDLNYPNEHKRHYSK